MKHTPGPWQHEGPSPGGHWAIFGPDGAWIADLAPGSVTEAEHKANAQLVAVAPALLAACEMLLNHHCTGDRHGKYTMLISHDEMNVVRNAVAAASQ